MKIKIFPLLTLLLLFMSKNACSQRNPDIIRFHVAPLSFFDPVAAVMQVGLQKNIGHRVAVSVDHGFNSNKLPIFTNNYGRKDYRYSKTKAELKYFMFFRGSDSVRTVPYLSVEGMYFPQKYYKEDDRLKRDGVYFRYAHAAITRTVWVGNVKLGLEHKFRNVVLEQYLGLGIRRVDTRHQTTGEVQDYMFRHDGFTFFSPATAKDGIIFRPNLAAGIKAGYMLRKKKAKAAQ